MRRVLPIIVTLLALLPVAAHADPVTGWIVRTLGIKAGSWLAAAIGIGVSIAASSLANRLLAGGKKTRQQDIRVELTMPDALPVHRFVYGYTWAPGTPVGFEVVGDYLYICYLLNSRPSDLSTHKLLLDKRAVEISGDPFNFSGPGASATNEPFVDHVRYWIGRGDQTTCPDLIVAESGYFAATDAWRGRTVFWARLKAGASEHLSERWPAGMPEVNVEGPWSLIHDPRSNTTGWTRNQALIVRDALRTNPLRPYANAYLRGDTFEWAADVADQLVQVNAGGTIPRYAADGILVWSDGAELEDQIEPLLAAGGSQLVRIGGRIGIVPAIWRPSVLTISDFTDGQPVELTRWRPADDLYTECVATYAAPDRAYEMAEAPVHIVPGAQAADGGTARRLDLPLEFVVDHRQAQRLAKIAVMRARMQRSIGWELFPTAFSLVAGSRCTVSLPDPFTPWNGAYEVETVNPAAGINDDESVTLRIPCTLRETSSDIYSWSRATEELPVEAAALDPNVPGVQRPASVTLTTGASVAQGGNARVRADWPASTTTSATGYEWQWRVDVDAWQEGGTITADAQRRGWIAPSDIGAEYRVRVRTIGIYGRSTWRVSSPITASLS